MFGRKQKKIDYREWKGIRIPNSIYLSDDGWNTIFVRMVMHVLSYRVTSGFDRNNKAIYDMRLLHIHRFSYMGGQYQIALHRRYITENVMSLAIEEANRLEKEWKENDTES